MNIKNIITWVIIIAISLSLALTTITNPTQKEKQNIIKIDSFIINKNEIENIINKTKDINPKIKRIENINSILEEKIIHHINSNIKIKKLGLSCEEKEIVYLIKKSKIFQKNNNFSKEKYIKYLENQKINEYIIQKNIKRLSENKKINTLIKSIWLKELKLKYSNKKNIYLEKIKYKTLLIKNLIKHIKIKKDFISFEKNYIKNYKLPKIYEIIYTNINNKKNKKILLSKNDINRKILNLINKNTHAISIKNKHEEYIIKKINKINQKNNKVTYKKDLINKYKKIKAKKLIKNDKKIIKNKAKEKIIFISPNCKKNYTIKKIKKQNLIKNKYGILIKNNNIKQTKIHNSRIKKNLTNHVKDIKYNLKKKLLDKDFFNTNRTY